MFSMPPATATLMFPREISWAAETMACAPEPQTRLTVSAGAVTGSPAWTAACRAGFILVPAWTTLPMTTVSTSSERSCARDCGTDRHGTEIGSGNVLETAAKCADRGANRFGENDCTRCHDKAS